MKVSTSTLRTKTLCAVAAIGASLVPYNVLADDVTLKSEDGKVNLVGELTSFDGGNYTIKTGFGEFTIAANGVICEGDGCPKPEVDAIAADVRIAGSDSVGHGIMPLLLAGYASNLGAASTVEEMNGSEEVVASIVGEDGFGEEMGKYHVNSSSSDAAFKALLAGTADLGMSSRRIEPKEAKSLADSGAGNMLDPKQEHIVAVDSLVIITHPDNPVQRISMDQLRGIYSGKIKNWSQLGGEDRAISVVTRQETSDTRAVFESRLFGGKRARVARTATIATGDSKMATAVTADEGAIGFVGSGYKRGAKALSLVSECGIVSAPDSFSAKTEEYPFQRRLYLYNRENGLNAEAQGFVDYATSTAADGVIAKAGFIDLSITSRVQDLNGSRARSLLQPVSDAREGNVMREMLSNMVSNNRLSTTFRFLTGSSTLDERGQDDIVRLVEYLETQPSGTKVTFVGFTDSVGSFKKNHSLSIGRADQVLRTLKASAGNRLDGIELTHTGYGEVAPSACNTTDFGRAVNRRVEVWIESPNNS